MRCLSDVRVLGRALAGVGGAAATWPYVFSVRDRRFWFRMTTAAGALGLHALCARPEMRQERPTRKDVAIGLASAVGLYVVFQIGDRAARRIMPAGAEDIEAIYGLRKALPRPVTAGLLIGVIGPSEELFWRGLVQHSFMERWGRIRGTLATAAVYGGVHLGARNLTLAGAAAVAGLYWGAEYAVSPRLVPLLVSHAVWDVWVFLVQPTPTGREGKP